MTLPVLYIFILAFSINQALLSKKAMCLLIVYHLDKLLEIKLSLYILYIKLYLSYIYFILIAIFMHWLRQGRKINSVVKVY